MSDVASRLAAVRESLAASAREHGRDPSDVHLVAVSKRHPAAAIAAAAAAGQRAFGENYVQEAIAKQDELASATRLEWHFIGAIQSNKTADIAARFDWVHTVDRARIADRLDAQRPAELAPLKVLIQVNVSGEQSKNGVSPAALPALVAHLAVLPRLSLRGLMCLPAPEQDFTRQRRPFAELARLARAQAVALDALSMGTSDDYAAAIAEGATLVRIGTAVFGPRPPA